MDKYQIVSTIGSGATSIVKLAKCNDSGMSSEKLFKIGQYVVLKEYIVPLSQYSPENQRYLSEEVSLLLCNPSYFRYLFFLLCLTLILFVMSTNLFTMIFKSLLWSTLMRIPFALFSLMILLIDSTPNT